MIGVTGHRDLVADELPAIRERVQGMFAELQRQFPELPILVMTPLAEGADRLVAEVASDMGLPVEILMPMPRALYQSDFSGESLVEFDEMLALGEIVELPLVSGNTPEMIASGGRPRDLQYAQLGAYLAAHSHILLAIWDGKPHESVGGTAHVVQFHQHDIIELLAEGQHRSPIDFAEDESDLVFHVACSREADGAPREPLQPGQADWLTRDDVQPRTAAMPERYRVVFERIIEFNADLDRPTPPGVLSPLVTGEDAEQRAPGTEDIERLYMVADFLAQHFKRYRRRLQITTYALVVCAMMSFIVWADLPNQEIMIYPYLGFISLVVGLVYLERRKGWQRRSLEYRVLAEGLRVQFWWSMAGVVMENPSRFSHDSFLRQQDLELGWIRNVMRFAGRRADANIGMADGVDTELVARVWVADQKSYYQSKSQERNKGSRLTSALVLATFGTGLVVAIVFAVFQSEIATPWSNILVALMGLLPFLAAVRQSYANSTAEREDFVQFGYMYRIFFNADRLLESARNFDARRDILRALGEAALEEHGQWMLRQRERPAAGRVLQGG
ncbi:MAG: hypothetical protein GWM88_01965 [Pseudomonadales bacterium]|nr:hypothetical protein [Pseudomonadales bacterium]NIX06845.1 hypothetical protein [Pseudomonadales bacterium]